MVVRLIVVLYMVLATTHASLAKGQNTCAVCRRAIESGEFVRADGQYYHAEHFICAYCRNPIGTARYFEKNGLRYDSACFVNEISDRCSYCRKPVGTNWVSYSGRQYHKECYVQNVALKCSFCGDIINGEYLRDQWGNSYHEYHKNEPRCLYCGRLITDETNGGKRFSDGRCVCGHCLDNAVSDMAQADSIMTEVRAILASEGIAIDHDDLPLSLVDSRKLSSFHGGKRTNLELEGLTRYEKRTWLGGLIDRVDFNIYILHSLPREHFCATVAHELMHVWLTLHAPNVNDDPTVEGTCNYAAYLVLKRNGGSKADFLIGQMLISSDPDYGEGLRLVKTQVESRTLEGWLNYLSSNEQPPW